MDRRCFLAALVIAMLLPDVPALRHQSGPAAFGSPGAQGSGRVSVRVQPPARVDVVLFSANAAGRVLTTTNQKGEGTIEAAAVVTLGRLDVIEETCGARRRVLLVAPNEKPAAERSCSRRSIGSFASATDNTLEINLFTPLPRPVAIPEPPANQPLAAAGRATPPPAREQPAQKPVTAAGVGCPAGAALIGPKLDLPSGGAAFEEAASLSECTYKGIVDTNAWRYFKVSLAIGQTLKVIARSRDTTAYPQSLHLRLHGPNGGQVGAGSMDRASSILEMTYTAKEAGFAYLAIWGVARDAAFQISLQ
jgi:hypothetical protein